MNERAVIFDSLIGKGYVALQLFTSRLSPSKNLIDKVIIH